MRTQAVPYLLLYQSHVCCVLAYRLWARLSGNDLCTVRRLPSTASDKSKAWDRGIAPGTEYLAVSQRYLTPTHHHVHLRIQALAAVKRLSVLKSR